MRPHTCHVTCVKVRELVGVGSLLPSTTCVPGIKLSCQAEQQVPLPAEPSHTREMFFVDTEAVLIEPFTGTFVPREVTPHQGSFHV